MAMTQYQYTLKGDRGIEWSYAKQQLLELDDDLTLFDLGPSRGAYMSRYAVEKGFIVTACALQPVDFEHQRFHFVLGDFLDVDVGGPFDVVVNTSTIEHFGLAGRYGVTVSDPTADLKGMRKLRGLMRPDSFMALTVPIGLDAVVGHYHRVYGRERLPMLLEGYEVLDEQYWAKFNGINIYEQTDKETALSVPPQHGEVRYYAIGTFTLGRKE